MWESDIERGEQTRLADNELRKLAIHAAGGAISPDDVQALTSDVRPASVFAITNALERREPARAAEALERALSEGQPVLRIMASLEGRLADLVAAADLVARRTPANEITRRLGRGQARSAERLVEAARRYTPAELEGMLNGLFDADVAIKSNARSAESAIAGWMGEYLLARRPVGKP